MKSKKLFITTLALIFVLLISCVGVFGLSHWNHSHGTENLGTKLYNTSFFFPGYKVVKGSGYGLKTGKYVTRCWTKISEGDWKETDYSKKLTDAQAKKHSKYTCSATVECWNNPFKSQKYTYGWNYAK